jgi:hypothetical protein
LNRDFSKFDVITIVLLLLNSFGLLGTLSAAGGLLVIGLLYAAQSGSLGASSLPYFSLAWTTAFISLLLLPSIYFSMRKLSGRTTSLTQPRPSRPRYLVFLASVWLVTVVCGVVVTRQTTLLGLVFPPFQLLAVFLPILILVIIIRRELDSGSPHRTWGLVSINLLIIPPLVMMMEILALGVIITAFGVWISTRPDLLELVTLSAQRLMNAGMDPEVIERVARPYLKQPFVIYLIFAAGAGVVPLIEELLKPAALWLWMRRGINPQQGFSMGLICGASFALLESLGMLATVTGEDWAVLVLGRMGTGLLHMTTSALMGYGLACAWSKNQFVRLGVVYLTAVALHSLWNVFSLLLGMSPFISSQSSLARLGQIAPLGLGVLMATLLMILTGASRRIKANN